MRILFVLKGLALVRHFDEVVTHLADAGHQIILAPTKFGDEELLPDGLAAHANCSVVSASVKRANAPTTVGILRHTRDYLRYQEPALAGAAANRLRALTNLVRVVSHGTRELPAGQPDLAVTLNGAETRRLCKAFDQLEGLIPADPAFERFIAAQRPDVMLITPLVSFGGLQSDYVKAARALGVPSACLVFSWDNLSNKGVMHERPDRTFVWNEVQRREAIDLHGVDPDAVVATGAPRFDPFYRMTPSVTREAFCRKHGLDPAKPLVAYLGSSPIVSPCEPAFAERWVESLRASTVPALQDAQIVIRPHPRLKPVWHEHPRFAKKTPPERRYPSVAVTDAKSTTGDQPLFDTLFHADAVVGLNTTAELEAGILGKPVYTVRATELAAGQTGSHHFHYLLREQGGFVECADTLEHHATQLADGLAGRFDRDGLASFIERFLRPRGLDRPVAPVLAAEIERWATDAGTVAGTLVVPPVPSPSAAGSYVRTPPRDPAVASAMTDTAAVSTHPIGQPTKTQVVYHRHPLFIFVSTHAERDWRLAPGMKEPWTVAWLDDNVHPRRRRLRHRRQRGCVLPDYRRQPGGSRHGGGVRAGLRQLQPPL